MRSATILSALLLAAASALPLASAARANIVISIDKSTQRMAVAVDGARRYVWPVSTGRPGYDTPSGTFRPNRMDPEHFSQEYDNAPMPDTIFFDLKGHAIHGFADVPHLGMAVSHGCVRLSPANAATLYDLVKSEGMGETTVIVAGRTPAWNGPAMARRQPPPQQQPQDEETAQSAPLSIAPQYGQQPSPYYGQPAYGEPAYAQRYYAQPQQYYAQPAYPPQPPPYYRQW